MKLFRRLTAGMIAALMVVSMLASCADNENEKKQVVDPAESKETKSDTPTFVEEDYNGATFTIVAYDESATDFIDNYIDNEEQNGEPVNDAVIDRNNAVEEKYNIDIVKRAVGSPQSVARSSSKSGTVDFEVLYEWGIRLVPIATEGTFYDFNQIPNIDFEQSYWAPSTQDDLTIADKMLISTSDITMNRVAWAYFLFFNANMIKDLGLEMPYTYVDSNEWTFDKFLEMVNSASQDNGDTIWDNQDKYGYLGSCNDCIKYFANCAGVLGTKKNDDGTYALDCMNDKIQQIYSTYYKNMATSPAFAELSIGDWVSNHDTSMFQSIYKAQRFIAFGESHALFAKFSMDMTGELTTMEDDYGVVPSPKMDSSQLEYYHVIDSCAPMLSVMKQAEDMDMIGVILEYMSYQSQEFLIPAFYEQEIKTKRMADLQGRDEKMLDIVRDTCHYSWTALYYLALKNQNGDAWDPCGTIIGDMLQSGLFASVYKRYESVAQSTINDLYDKVLEMDVNK